MDILPCGASLITNDFQPESCFAEAAGVDASGKAESDSNQPQNSRVDEPMADDKGETMPRSLESIVHRIVGTLRTDTYINES